MYLNMDIVSRAFLKAIAERADRQTICDLIMKCPNLYAADENGNTALHLAVINIDLPLVRGLIDLRAGLNIQNNNGDTPLLLVAKIGNRKLKNLLVMSGADMTIENNNGNTYNHIVNSHLRGPR